jgi:ATP-binding cassette subfamily F protein uup
MVSYLQIEGLTKSFGDRMLFADVTFGVYQGDKIGLIARNGAGKSTLMSIIAGNEDYDSGSVVFRNGIKVGYLPQLPIFDTTLSPIDNVVSNLSYDQLHETPDQLREHAARLLTQFGITDYNRQVTEFSGGQLKRMALVRVMLEEPDILLFDEPTNHLDIDMIEWLENYLSHKNVTLLLVTHDRYFLDRVCSKIIEIDRQQIFTYEGNYDYYLRRRQERMENLSAELARVNNLFRTELEWMRRQPQARGSKAKYRIDNFHDLEARRKVDLSNKNVSLNVKSDYIGSKIFEAVDVCKSFGDIKILDHWNYTFARYEKVGIVGDNGVGKSTFIKLLLGELPLDSGNFDVGQTVKWGYYSQEGMTNFDSTKRVIDAVREIAEDVRIDDKTRLSASQFLNHFLFTPETQQKYIAKLSGGERRRLYLATVLMKSPNFLILDEPTNDLDIMTLAVLEDYLINFKGCVIVVSHDRYFLDRIVDHLFVFKGNGIVRDFPGDYSTYRHCVQQEERERRAAEAEVKTLAAEKKGKPIQERKRGLSFKEKRELEDLNQKLDTMTAERAELEMAMSAGTMGHEELLAAGKRMEVLIESIDETEMRLLELMEKE